MFGINDVVKELTERGGKTRGITDITYSMIPLVQEVADIGEDVRHFGGYLSNNGHPICSCECYGNKQQQLTLWRCHEG